jgi:hypothetical protein
VPCICDRPVLRGHRRASRVSDVPQSKNERKAGRKQGEQRRQRHCVRQLDEAESVDDGHRIGRRYSRKPDTAESRYR